MEPNRPILGITPSALNSLPSTLWKFTGFMECSVYISTRRVLLGRRLIKSKFIECIPCTLRQYNSDSVHIRRLVVAVRQMVSRGWSVASGAAFSRQIACAGKSRIVFARLVDTLGVINPRPITVINSRWRWRKRRSRRSGWTPARGCVMLTDGDWAVC